MAGVQESGGCVNAAVEYEVGTEANGVMKIMNVVSLSLCGCKWAPACPEAPRWSAGPVRLVDRACVFVLATAQHSTCLCELYSSDLRRPTEPAAEQMGPGRAASDWFRSVLGLHYWLGNILGAVSDWCKQLSYSGRL
ncbi:hypothetical protein MHYP_G00155840 [Metynnis hypsauchen]